MGSQEDAITNNLVSYNWKDGSISIWTEPRLAYLVKGIEGARKHGKIWRVPMHQAAYAANLEKAGFEVKPYIKEQAEKVDAPLREVRVDGKHIVVRFPKNNSLSRTAEQMGGEDWSEWAGVDTEEWRFPREMEDKVRRVFAGFVGNEKYVVEITRPEKIDPLKALAKLGDLSKQIPNGWTLYEHQQDSVREVLKTPYHGRVLALDYGLGKCLHPDTEVLMYDGSIKKAKDVRVGDRLMGDDSTPRNVMSLARGREQMYKIELINGDSYICNGSHIMSLVISSPWKGKKLNRGDKVDMSVNDYLNLNMARITRKNILKHYKASVEFSEQKVPMDAYLYGAWLGDGHKSCLAWTINNRDQEIVSAIRSFVKSSEVDMYIREVDGRGCKTYFVSKTKPNSHTHCDEYYFTQSSYKNEGKRIDRRYLINSREVRLELLAGLLDTDGYLIDKVFEIVTKWEGLRDDILFLARSLGFSVRWREKIVNETSYWRIYISGFTGKIPCRTRKKAGPRKQVKNPLVYGFTIEPLGVGDYCGFEIDGNKRFLLGDFTVTHNTFVSAVVAMGLQKAYGMDVIVLTPASLQENWARELDKLVENPIILSDHHSKIPMQHDKPFVLIADEAHRLAGHSNRGDAFVSLSQQASFALPLTGAPVRHGQPGTAYNLLKAIGHPLA